MSFRTADVPVPLILNRLAGTSERVGRSLQRLASGLRIPTAADDASGLAMSDRLRARIRSLDQARRNATDGVSMVQIAEGALGEVSSLLIRMRELAVQARNGTASTTDRVTIDREFQALAAEITRIGEATQWNGIRLLNGSRRSVELQIDAGTRIGIDTLTVPLSPLASTLNVRRQSVATTGAADLAMRRLDRAIDRLGSMRGSFGAVQQRLEHTISHLGSTAEQASAAESRIRDIDIAGETAELTRQTILRQATFAVLAQANVQPRSALRLLDTRA
ncbi:MAG: flagellin FliC [Planctomycetes bacterium]|jgi:flagellin|nr:flagellin FliC [Planctomycetota bacterium]